jgi:adenylate kinase
MAKAVIIYGPPGAGKGTQAELLERNFDFIHFDTGRYVERLVHSPEAEKNKILKREQVNFNTGKLMTPAWIIKISRAAALKIAKTGNSAVFSGSPRTLFEAFGDPPALTSPRRRRVGRKTKGLFEILLKLFGRENIFIIHLLIPPSVSTGRNQIRRVCSVCGLPAMRGNPSPRCLFCGGPMRTRTLDKASVIKIRLKEYRDRTFPILKKAKKIGIKIFEIDGKPLPYKVHRQIVKKIKLR